MLQAKLEELSRVSPLEVKSQKSHVELQDLAFALLVFGLVLVQYFLTMPLFLPFGMGMCIRFHCTLGVCNLPFDFTGAYS